MPIARTMFFLPVFNQVGEFPQVLEEIRHAKAGDVDFFFVNNGSTDGSEKLVADSGFPYLDVSRNRGVGYSYMLALDRALDMNYEFFGTMASNGKMDAREIPRLLEPLRRAEADYVSGSRFLGEGLAPNLPTFRRTTIPLVNVVARATTGRTLTDATNGFRAYRLDAIKHARFDWHQDWLWTYGLEYYIYAKFLRDKRMMCVEVPSSMRYPPSGPYTKIRPGMDWWAMIRPWLAAMRGPGFS